MSNDALNTKHAQMCEIIASLDRVAVAFSAGVDSTLVLKIALDVLGPRNVIAVTGKSESLAAEEFDQAVKLTQQLGAEHVVLQTPEFDLEDYVSNPNNRCYFCKTTLYQQIERHFASRGTWVIVNGINADDRHDFRPGIVAANEHGVRCPAAEAGLTKQDIRALSERLGLPTFDKPASPCLSSRVQYGERITPEKLRRIESCEAFLRDLGFRECRVRHHDTLARIEVPADQVARLAQPRLRRRIIEHFRHAGYNYVTLDLHGFRSGSMNEVITLGKLQSAP